MVAQKAKVKINRSSTTNMQAWLTKLLRGMISLFPIFFDRVDASTSRLYGFQKSQFEPSQQPGARLGVAEDLVGTVEEFLSLEDKAGQPLAIAVVIDAVNTSNLNMERGLAVSGPTNSQATITDNGNLSFYDWPAVFFRSNQQQPASVSTSRNTSPQSLAKAPGGGGASGLLGMRRRDRDGTTAVLTDDAEASAKWPMSSWENILPTLQNDYSSTSSRNGGFIAPVEWTQADSETLVHSARVNPYMWLMVLTKSMDDGRWHRRRPTKLVEEEIQQFFDGLLNLLRKSNWFNAKRSLEIRRQGPEPFSFFLGENLMEERRTWDDVSTANLVESFQETFGLRSPRRRRTDSRHKSPLTSGRERFQTTRTTHMLSYYKSPALRRILPKSSQRPKPSHQVSANAFFLGEELMNAVETDEDWD